MYTIYIKTDDNFFFRYVNIDLLKVRLLKEVNVQHGHESKLLAKVVCLPVFRILAPWSCSSKLKHCYHIKDVGHSRGRLTMYILFYGIRKQPVNQVFSPES